jgi:bacterioferritin-associated ferredoxin
MYVCVCHAVTDHEIRQCAELGARTFDELRDCLGVATCCGKCEHTAREVFSERGACAAARATSPA